MNEQPLRYFYQFDKLLFLVLSFLLSVTPMQASNGKTDTEAVVNLFPVDKANEVNPDTHLSLTFNTVPTLGKSGQIRIYDATDDRLVDRLDLSLPPGPTRGVTGPKAPYTPTPYEYVSGRFTNANTKPGTPSGIALPTPDTFQLTIIGSFTDGFHFYPVIIRGLTATIYLHNNLLEYGKTYYVQVDPGVLTVENDHFQGITGKTGWMFQIKPSPPPANSDRLIVSADGTGDFNTVQGAIDFIPDHHPTRVTVFIKNGHYEEIVYFRNKSNITILGEDREKVHVYYHNNEVFNPHPSNVSTNELPGTFPSRRAAFMVDNSTDIHLVNMTIKTTAKGQAEGLLLNGERNIISHVTIVGSGDALQSNGSAYYTHSRIVGDGDMILGRGPAFFKDCILNSYSVYMWIRNTESNHGNVFLNCTFQTLGNGKTELARAPVNGGKSYPFCEAVLINCALGGISPVGWGRVGGETTNIHYWEYNSTNLSDGTPIDASQRHPVSRQLNRVTDSDIIVKYSDPAYVLGGWKPAMVPIILSQPMSQTLKTGEKATFNISVAAVPEVTFQWYKNGKPIERATEDSLVLEKVHSEDTGFYTVTATNHAGQVTSQIVRLEIKSTVSG